MASQLDIPSAGGTSSTFNSGVPLADVIRDIPYGLIFLDNGVEFDATDMASSAALIAAIDEATRAARGSRAYPLWDLKNFEDKSKEPVKGTLGNLSNADIQLVEGIPSFDFTHRKGELFHRALIEAETANLTVLIVDKKYVIYGTRTSADKLAGYTMAEFKCQLPKWQTPGQASSYPFSITLDSMAEYKENGAFFQCDSSLVNISGIVPVILTQVSFVSSVLKVKPTTLGGTNLAVTNGTNLTQATAWKVTNVTAGTFATVSAAYDSATESMALTLSGTPFTGAASGDEFYVELAASAVLEASPINLDGYETPAQLTVEKP
jgi:hypothetical protein